MINVIQKTSQFYKNVAHAERLEIMKLVTYNLHTAYLFEEEIWLYTGEWQF